ncbi:hypothetical protein CAOG_009385 [Capsaspora owczarzaki ATCC 30864]|uniref:Uncharacterized protein n=1 Tax=Capsaspora owczarzaki (strain ATCC 30864) TaxID=595528 RepID=A0A0D2VIB7_CAPO3|nr:hypothetical protein CAOG_009385 [Capsaspora owczarzaki ATCC 30864]
MGDERLGKLSAGSSRQSTLSSGGNVHGRKASRRAAVIGGGFHVDRALLLQNGRWLLVGCAHGHVRRDSRRNLLVRIGAGCNRGSGRLCRLVAEGDHMTALIRIRANHSVALALVTFQADALQRLVHVPARALHEYQATNVGTNVQSTDDTDVLANVCAPVRLQRSQHATARVHKGASANSLEASHNRPKVGSIARIARPAVAKQLRQRLGQSGGNGQAQTASGDTIGHSKTVHTVERDFASQHFPQHDAIAPDVGGTRHAAATDDLGAHPAKRTGGGRPGGARVCARVQKVDRAVARGADATSQAKVGQLDGIVLAQKNVGRLEIAVNDSERRQKVEVVHGGRQLHHPRVQERCLRGLALCESMGESASRGKLHDNAKVGLGEDCAHESDNVGVRKVAKQLRLLAQLCGEVGRGLVRASELFDGNALGSKHARVHFAERAHAHAGFNGNVGQLQLPDGLSHARRRDAGGKAHAFLRRQNGGGQGPQARGSALGGQSKRRHDLSVLNLLGRIQRRQLHVADAPGKAGRGELGQAACGDQVCRVVGDFLVNAEQGGRGVRVQVVVVHVVRRNGWSVHGGDASTSTDLGSRAR